MSKRKTGREIPCTVCGKLVYRRQSQIDRGVGKTCGSRECKSVSMMGENNPFWNKTHTPEVRAKLSERQRDNPSKGTGPKKGVFKQTKEAREAMSEAMRLRWIENRDLMLSYIPKGPQHPYQQVERDLRHRIIFTPVQKEEWIDGRCFYCHTTEDLILDHIIPVMAGGIRDKSNSQTLCGPCNRWKLRYVDIPFYKAYLGTKGAKH